MVGWCELDLVELEWVYKAHIAYLGTFSSVVPWCWMEGGVPQSAQQWAAVVRVMNGWMEEREKRRGVV